MSLPGPAGGGNGRPFRAEASPHHKPPHPPPLRGRRLRRLLVERPADAVTDDVLQLRGEIELDRDLETDGERFDRDHADLLQLGLDLGGTITGEHGVGRLKASMLPVELGETNTRIQRELRRVFDPNGTLNPGVNLASDHS